MRRLVVERHREVGQERVGVRVGPRPSWRTRMQPPLGAIVAGCDVHRAPVTFDALDTETGGVTRGCFTPKWRGAPEVNAAHRLRGRPGPSGGLFAAAVALAQRRPWTR